MKKLMRYLLLILGTLLVINLFIVPLYEPSLIYFPAREIGRDPGSIGLAYEDVYIRTEDGVKINGWFVKNNDSNKVILLFHGNGGNISHRLPLIKLLYDLPANIFIIDYHGYGRSEGKPSEQNLYLDARASYDHLIDQKKYQPEQIIVMGSSLGGAVATELAVSRKIGGLVLLRSFTSVPAMAPRLNPLYRWPIIWPRSKFDSLARISRIKAPLLIVHSKEDEMIPCRMSVSLYEKALQPKKLLLLEKGGHNDLYATPEYVRSLRKILK
ncbi:MAG: alpha/beta hydrolase [Candidatus Margulisiibacteriota bacterium]